MKKLLTLLMIGISISAYSQGENIDELNGSKIHYVIRGEGEPVLLLHNFFASHKMWLPWIEDLPKTYKYIIPDLRGHGLSTNPAEVYRHNDNARDIYSLLDSLGIDKFKAIGTSSGGMTLLHMATLDTTRIEKMILIGATIYFPSESREIGTKATYETIDEAWRQMILYHQPGGEKQARELLRLFREVNATYNDMNFTSPYLSSIKCPTLIIHGDRDPFFPIDIPVEKYKSIPDSYLWVIPNGGHLPFVHSKENSIWSTVFIKVMDDFFEGNLVKS